MRISGQVLLFSALIFDLVKDGYSLLDIHADAAMLGFVIGAARNIRSPSIAYNPRLEGAFPDGTSDRCRLSQNGQ